MKLVWFLVTLAGVAALPAAACQTQWCVDQVWDRKHDGGARTVYDKAGRVLGHAVTDRAGNRTLYGPHGQVITREFTDTQGTTTIYDGAGNRISASTMPRKARP
jgi:YD repeat-containing protein